MLAKVLLVLLDRGALEAARFRAFDPQPPRLPDGDAGGVRDMRPLTYLDGRGRVKGVSFPPPVEGL